jgi:uncharacterized protein
MVKPYISGVRTTDMTNAHDPLLVLLSALSLSASPALARQAFEIAAGNIAGDLYLKGERLAAAVSHPPGLSRCADPKVCGPEGLIATARATSGDAEGLLAITRGEAASAFAPADIAAALRLNVGKGKQNQSRLRTIGVVGSETLYVIAAAKGPVRSIASLKNRWVGVGQRGGRTRIAANALLAAAKLQVSAVRTADVEGAEAARLMKEKRLDAIVWIGTKLPAPLKALLAEGAARIVPVDGATRERLAAARLGYAPVRAANPSGPGAIETISVPVIWLADEKQDPEIVYRVVRAAFHPQNATTLSPDPAERPAFQVGRPSADFVVPLHPGAVRYFAEAPRPSN